VKPYPRNSPHSPLSNTCFSISVSQAPPATFLCWAAASCSVTHKHGICIPTASAAGVCICPPSICTHGHQDANQCTRSRWLVRGRTSQKEPCGMASTQACLLAQAPSFLRGMAPAGTKPDGATTLSLAQPHLAHQHIQLSLALPQALTSKSVLGTHQAVMLQVQTQPPDACEQGDLPPGSCHPAHSTWQATAHQGLTGQQQRISCTPPS
jgi:hypothetical protein